MHRNVRQSESAGRSLLWLRVALLVAGAVAGLWLSFTPAAGLYRVRARSYADLRRIQAEAATTQPASEQLPTVQGDQAWQDLAQQVFETTAGTSSRLRPNLDTGLGENDCYFLPEQLPLPHTAGQESSGTSTVYVQVAPAGRPGYLEVVHLPRGVGIRHAPAFLAYPLRPYAVWCFVAGIAGFVLVPHQYYRWHSLRRAEIAMAITLAGGLAFIWLLPADPARPLEKRPEVSPEVLARQEQIVKELAALQQQMREALPETEKGTLLERKAKLEGYRVMVARYSRLSQEFVEGDAGGVESPATQPESHPMP